MRYTFLGLLAVAAFSSAVARAAEPSAACDRAMLYEQEVRTALIQHSWRITRDATGTITAEKLWLEPGLKATPSLGNYARLEIGFHADNTHHTTSVARASLCLYNPFLTTHVGESIYPPLPLHSAKLTQEYHDILAEAELRLAVDHRAYAATGANHPSVDQSKRVAVK